jgi:hypothetical protein
MNFMQAFQTFSNQQSAGYPHGFSGYPQAFQPSHTPHAAPPHMPLTAPVQTPLNTLAQMPPNYATVCGEVLVPSISEWLSYCDTVKNRKERSGIVYAQFSSKFDELGIDKLDQLDGVIVSAKDLAGWLGTKLGVTVDIMRYAKADLEAITAGQVIIPANKQHHTE